MLIKGGSDWAKLLRSFATRIDHECISMYYIHIPYNRYVLYELAKCWGISRASILIQRYTWISTVETEIVGLLCYKYVWHNFVQFGYLNINGFFSEYFVFYLEYPLKGYARKWKQKRWKRMKVKNINKKLQTNYKKIEFSDTFDIRRPSWSWFLYFSIILS